VFLCIDWNFLFRVGENEASISRLDFSDGRFGGNAIEDLARHSVVTHFKGRRYQLKCVLLAVAIRFGVVTGNWKLLELMKSRAMLLHQRPPA
jgi:hypothetical protein